MPVLELELEPETLPLPLPLKPFLIVCTDEDCNILYYAVIPSQSWRDLDRKFCSYGDLTDDQISMLKDLEDPIHKPNPGVYSEIITTGWL
jgi:hypothetical protein